MTASTKTGTKKSGGKKAGDKKDGTKKAADKKSGKTAAKRSAAEKTSEVKKKSAISSAKSGGGTKKSTSSGSKKQGSKTAASSAAKKSTSSASTAKKAGTKKAAAKESTGKKSSARESKAQKSKQSSDSGDQQHVLSIDQGTTSTRAIIFDHNGEVVASGQLEHEQIFPRAGWIEHDANEIWRNTREVVALALSRASLNADDLAAVGITNQRETTVVWDRKTGEPVYNAIVWQDTRTSKICRELAGDKGADRFADICGLPLATYFCGPKLKWILDNVKGVRKRAEAGELMMGTMDTWLLWQLTGGKKGGVHVTDVTNASRTMLMNLKTLEWDESIAEAMSIPMSLLPEIKSSSEVYGKGRKGGFLTGVPIAGILGDQHAATFGQACLEEGTAKNTYGTGCFLILNTGNEIVRSSNGLLTTVCYKLGDADPVYALEGSIAVAGSLVQWLRDNLGLFSDAAEVEKLAKKVDDNGGAYIVPAFSGLFAPHWRDDARGVIVGLTRYVNRKHLARAALESVAFQTREVVEAMVADSGADITELKVDGGMTVNELLLQFQADQLGVPVVRPKVSETTALGAAYAAGIAVGFWTEQDVTDNWAEDSRLEPTMDDDERQRLYRNWRKAVERTLNWVDEDTER